jgi:hypothetical protein
LLSPRSHKPTRELKAADGLAGKRAKDLQTRGWLLHTRAPVSDFLRIMNFWTNCILSQLHHRKRGSAATRQTDEERRGILQAAWLTPLGLP